MRGEAKIYYIELTNGNAVRIKATDVEWCEKTRTVRFLFDRQVAARINMDNVVGWIDKDYKVGN